MPNGNVPEANSYEIASDAAINVDALDDLKASGNEVIVLNTGCFETSKTKALTELADCDRVCALT